ncbi:ATPase associated with various cellular activities AAA_5 [Desulfofarcimen acetoxidans DSM 771]|jgi:MoxR-like ATPase|uniref:ATPase associated with various cellular activities AAA_5 n=1 Tax=Desulfofarcimen acetoxidans (strain ATCC 49208 / DSM 771 / KCTC 5769 / VKM B-1644 / 5575) TaxID=485916 RepID=C8W250_DESAS|nr:MoxR family ATPase [Desulfofarcimen acetoxidans]ACV61714.1 ATPase associated with various cellular activities AAA_5 [Desulfofarcimen acetoxidans DSM 771]
MDITVNELQKTLEEQGYICDMDLATTIFLSLKLEKPLLVEGAPGVGKTEIAKVLSQAFGLKLIRLQCYEGLDENKSLYEWNYQRQLLKIQILRGQEACSDIENDLFNEEYLLERPLLKAIRSKEKAVLLIDECDKVDEPFEAFLFEILSDFQVSIPELGTLTARNIPIVVLTSNGEREISDGLKRRCIYLYINYPSVEKEVKILRTKVPEAGEKLSLQVARAVGYIRNNLDLIKQPSISESIDWARALVALSASSIDEKVLAQTLSVLLKNNEDMQTIQRAGLDSVAVAARDNPEKVQSKPAKGNSLEQSKCHCSGHGH